MLWSEATALQTQHDRVMIVGGYANSAQLASVEEFDVSKGTWTLLAPMSTPRWFHVAAKLLTGQVLVVGGWVDNVGYQASAELY